MPYFCAVFFLLGPIVSFLMTKMSYCTVALIGSALVVTGILLMPFLTYLPVMCFSFGVLTGKREQFHLIFQNVYVHTSCDVKTV